MCEGCGRPLAGKYANAKTCSATCRKRAQRSRMHEQELDEQEQAA
jgi:hypothetical protein